MTFKAEITDHLRPKAISIHLKIHFINSSSNLGGFHIELSPGSNIIQQGANLERQQCDLWFSIITFSFQIGARQDIAR